MSTPLSDTHLPALQRLVREEVATVLQQTLVELVDLGLLGKQLHWTVVGELFRPLHAQLDELVDSWREMADTVAERIVAVGASPDAQASTVAKDSGWDRIEVRALSSQEVVRIVTQRLSEAAERDRDRMIRLGNLDLASQDVLIEQLREMEKQLWMLRVQFSEPTSNGRAR